MSIVEINGPEDFEKLRKFVPGQQVSIAGISDEQPNLVFNVSLYSRQRTGVEFIHLASLEKGHEPRNLRRSPPAPQDHQNMLWTIDQLKTQMSLISGFTVDPKIPINVEEKQSFPIIGGTNTSVSNQQGNTLPLANLSYLNQLRADSIKLAQTPNNSDPISSQLYSALAAVLGAIILNMGKK